MGRYFTSLVVLFCFLFTSCNDYQAQIDDLQKRIDDVEAEIGTIQTTAASLPQLFQAVKDGRSVSNFIPIAASDGTLLGFKIYFKDGGNCTLYNTPFSLVPCKDGDTYYWKDGENWIKDENGERVAISVDTPTLDFKQDGDKISYSCDGGETWRQAGNRTQYLFKSIEEDADGIVLTLADNTTVTLAKYKESGLSLKLGTMPRSITSGSTVKIPYSVIGDTEQVNLRAVTPEGWSVEIVQKDATSGTICITAPQKIYAAAITIIADNGAGKATAADIKFKEYEDSVIETHFETYEEAKSAHSIEVILKTNLSYSIQIDKSAKSWITVCEDTKALRTDLWSFNLAENTSANERTGKITFKSGIYSTSIMVIQAGSTKVKEPTHGTKEATDFHIKKYLEREFLSEVTEVNVEDDKIVVKGHSNGVEGYYLAEIPAYEVASDMEEFEYKTPITSRDFTITLDRYTKHQGITADRLLSSWAIIKCNDSEEALASHARYADTFPCPTTPPAPVYKTQKGLGGYWGHKIQTADLDSLHVSSVTINIRLNYYMTSNTGSEYYNDYCGKRYYYKYIDKLDKLIKNCSDRGIVVSVIILIQRTNSILQHPECNGGNYSMPNMTTQESVNAYAAMLEYLADRYSHEDGRYGLIHKWIMHNEVDLSTTWTNMGQQPLNRYMDAYYHSMRICHNVARCHNEYAEVMASFTNSWTHCNIYAPKDMLDILLQYSECEGDFKWGLAYHSYPQDLSNPKVWNDSNATFSMRTPMISFKNLEVLDKWIQMPANMYKHTEKRGLWLSENGGNTPSYSDTDFKNQAACAAWALYKVSQLEGIDAITWHNWYDDTSEGSLKLGLRKKQSYEFEAKPAYYVYQAGMTDDWESVFEPYLKVIGISDWPSIMHSVN